MSKRPLGVFELNHSRLSIVIVSTLKLLFITLVVVTLTFLNFSVKGEQQFSYLAKSFLSEKLYFLEEPLSWNDTTLFNGKHYWPLAPLPAVGLMPFVFIFGLFGKFFYQGYLQFFLVLGVFFLVVKTAMKLEYTKSDSIVLGLAFCVGSSFLGVAMWPWGWNFSQVIGTFLMLLLIFEFLSKKRYLILGVIAGFLLLTRSLSSLILFLFIFHLLFIDKRNLKGKMGDLFRLLAPFSIAFAIFFLYNFLRFGNIFEMGYKLQIVPEETARARGYGIFSLNHLPGNLYYFLLSQPQPVYRDNISQVLKFPFIEANPWGMGIVFTSPYLLFLFFVKYKDKLQKLIILIITLIALPIFLYYGIGWRQFGYRYSLDFLPLLFLIFMMKYKEGNAFISMGMKISITIVSITNLYLFFTFINLLLKQ